MTPEESYHYLSTQLVQMSYGTPDAKLAWRAEDAIKASEEMERAGISVIRIQAWVIVQFPDQPQTHSHVLPMGDGKATIREWQQTDPWMPARESWEEFCSRTAEAGRRFLHSCLAEAIVIPRLRDRVYYYLEPVTESEWLGD